jgi:hypothetical protein
MDERNHYFVYSHVFDVTRPVFLVSRESGDWQFLCGGTHDGDEKSRVVGLHHLIERDRVSGRWSIYTPGRTTKHRKRSRAFMVRPHDTECEVTCPRFSYPAI